ncbi:hypothetical protein TcWFU_005992 [Taenia crassiceps]|uniref:Uncharacterized protein n=1 Tax=Taenia crassiceps TaxID=6207 RepID=A0ABR4QHE6_9CEST
MKIVQQQFAVYSKHMISFTTTNIPSALLTDCEIDYAIWLGITRPYSAAPSPPPPPPPPSPTRHLLSPPLVSLVLVLSAPSMPVNICSICRLRMHHKAYGIFNCIHVALHFKKQGNMAFCTVSDYCTN